MDHQLKVCLILLLRGMLFIIYKLYFPNTVEVADIENFIQEAHIRIDVLRRN